MAAVDQPLVPQAHEHLAHGARVARVERKAEPGPVGRAADDLELLDDRVAGLFDEAPDFLDEALAAQVEPAFALLGEALLDDVLRRDAGVVGPRQPFGGPAAHPLEP